MVIECKLFKLLHGSLGQTIRDGVSQTLAYLDHCGSAEGHLVVFDRTEGKPWEQKLFCREASAADGTAIAVCGGM